MEKSLILEIQTKRDEYAKKSNVSYQDYDDCDKAIEYMYKAIELSKSLPFEDNDFLAKAAYCLGQYYEDNEEIEHSRTYYKDAVDLYEKTSNVYDVCYLKSLGALANYEAIDCHYQKASLLFTKGISLIEALPKKNREIIELELSFLSNYTSCYDINHNQETISECNRAVRCLTGKVDKRTLKKVKLHLFLGEFYFLSKGDYANAASNFEKSLFLGEDIFKQNLEQGATVNYYIAYTNYLAATYDKAIKYYEDAKQAYISLKNNKAVECALNIVLINIILGNEDIVEEDIKKIETYLNQVFGAKASDMLIDIRSKIAQKYFDLGNMEKANLYI